MNYKKVFLYLILFVFVFVLGGIAGGLFVKNKIKIEKDKILSDCWDNARKELVGVCKPVTEINENVAITNFYGKLLEIKPDLKQIIIDPAPLGDGEDKISTLILQLNSDTKIEQVVKKDDTAYQKELEEFNVKYETDKTLPYPLQYQNKPVDISVFQVGQSITVFSEEDVRNSKSVKALKLIINFQ